MASLLSLVKREMENKGMVQIPLLVEKLCVSVGGHVFNLTNLDNRRFYHAGSLENFRSHVVIMAPSGFSKTTYIKFFLDPHHGILSHCYQIFPTTVRSTFSSESWIGTIYQKGKKIEASQGLFSRFKRGIIGADEFMRLKDLAEAESKPGRKHTNEEVYLLSALEGETATKDLSFGTIEETDIGTTIWPGMRLTKLDTTSGLLRRFIFHIIFPTPQLAKEFKQAIRNKQISKPISPVVKEQVKETIEEMKQVASEMKEIDYSEIEKYLNGSMKVSHVEERIYKRIAVGYAFASGTLPDIVMDDTLEAIFRHEQYCRYIIRDDPEKEAIYQVALATKDEPLTKEELETFMFKYYYMNRYRFHRLFHLLTAEGLIQVRNDHVHAVERNWSQNRFLLFPK